MGMWQTWAPVKAGAGSEQGQEGGSCGLFPASGQETYRPLRDAFSWEWGREHG